MSNKRLFAWSMFIAILIWVGSCKPKEDEVTPEAPDSVSIIAKTCILLEERINDALYRAYEYDSTRRLMRVYEYSADATLNRLVKRYTFEYDPKDSTKIIRFRETNLAQRDQSYIYEIYYADNSSQFKHIIPYRVYNSGARPIDTVFVYYNDDKRVSEMKASSIFHYVWDYDSAGNVQKWSIRRPEQSSDSLLAEYTEYDDKINLYQFSKGVQLLNLLHGQPPSRRNPLKYNILGQEVLLSYNYNAKGLPIESTAGFRNIGDTMAVTQQRSFQLDCK